MAEFFIPIVGIVATFMSATIVVYLYLTTRNKERLALLAKDKDASVFKSRRECSFYGIRLGILLIFFGIGALVGIGLVQAGILTVEMAILGICPIFLGFGLIFSQKWLEEKEDDMEV